MPKLLTPVHPGEFIREDVLAPLNLSDNHLAKLLAMVARQAKQKEIERAVRPRTQAA